MHSGEIPFDLTRMNEAVSQQLARTNGQLVNIPSLLLVICWVVGVTDSFRIGRSQEKWPMLPVRNKKADDPTPQAWMSLGIM